MPPIALVCSAVSFLRVCNSHVQMAFSSPSRPLPSRSQKRRIARHLQPAFPTVPVGQLWLPPAWEEGLHTVTPAQPLCSGGPALALSGLLGATCLCWLQGVLQWVWGRALCEALCSKLCLISRATQLWSKGSGIFWSLGT